MTALLLISALPGEVRAAQVLDGRLQELVIQRDDWTAVTGDIYLGRVQRIDKGLDAAFVDIGLERPGFLPRKAIPDQKVTEGQAVIVRVIREAALDKGVKLTAKLPDPPAGITELAAVETPPKCLYRGGDPLFGLFEEPEDYEEILVDDSRVYQRIKLQLAQSHPEILDRLKFVIDSAPLFDRPLLDHGLDQGTLESEIDALLDPLVPLPSGGSLLIEPTRTLTAIDVNSARHDGRAGKEHQAFAVNMEAADEIARQLRLRAMSGLFVIDFLDVMEASSRQKITQALEAGLKAGGEAYRVYPMKRSGLVEMTRGRSRPALHEVMTRPCGIGGGGRVKAPVPLAFEALRAARRVASLHPSRTVTVRAAADVVAALDGAAKEARTQFKERFGRDLDVVVDATQDSYEITVE